MTDTNDYHLGEVVPDMKALDLHRVIAEALRIQHIGATFGHVVREVTCFMSAMAQLLSHSRLRKKVPRRIHASIR